MIDVSVIWAIIIGREIRFTSSPLRYDSRLHFECDRNDLSYRRFAFSIDHDEVYREVAVTGSAQRYLPRICRSG